MKYSKLLGSLVGGLAGALVSFGLLPEALATPEIQASVVALGAAILTYIFPPNTVNEEE